MTIDELSSIIRARDDDGLARERPIALQRANQMRTHRGTRRLRVTSADGLRYRLMLGTEFSIAIGQGRGRAKRDSKLLTRDGAAAKLCQKVREARVVGGAGDGHVKGEIGFGSWFALADLGREFPEPVLYLGLLRWRGALRRQPSGLDFNRST